MFGVYRLLKSAFIFLQQMQVWKGLGVLVAVQIVTTTNLQTTAIHMTNTGTSWVAGHLPVMLR